MQYSNNKLCELVINLLKINSSDNVVLDLGSGTGNFLANVNKYMIKKGILLKDCVSFWRQWQGWLVFLYGYPLP